ncbi:hypothetical protein RvY_11200 [Ramazzottius varieornatus]|uniref:Uncharacterized protein n=1 Tax=Ramazzottius varieornatus TaxID=947166 RepID=A0A1D1VJQ3_RAMVA|nr:hypothetical protein RvY_11200 [Ramazzottius varieornatus]
MDDDFPLLDGRTKALLFLHAVIRSDTKKSCEKGQID